MDQAATVSLLETLLIGMTMMFLMALGVVSFFLVYQRKLSRHQENEQLQALRYQQDLLKTAVAAEEQERNRIARELHDDVGMLLSTTKLYMSQLRNDPPPDERTELIQQAWGLLDENLAAIRRISQDLRPVTLEKFGLAAGLEDIAHKINETNALTVHYACEGEPYRLPHEHGLALYRVIQELTNNTLKHAGAEQIWLHLAYAPNSVRLRYADDGRGLPDAVKAEAKGLGLRTMESRLATIGGTLAWEPPADSGMAVTITLPQSPTADEHSHPSRLSG